MKNKQPSKIELHRQAVSASLPEVKALVAKHGHGIVNSCLLRLKEHAKKLKEVEKLKAQIEELQRDL